MEFSEPTLIATILLVIALAAVASRLTATATETAAGELDDPNPDLSRLRNRR